MASPFPGAWGRFMAHFNDLPNPNRGKCSRAAGENRNPDFLRILVGCRFDPSEAEVKSDRNAYKSQLGITSAPNRAAFRPSEDARSRKSRSFKIQHFRQTPSPLSDQAITFGASYHRNLTLKNASSAMPAFHPERTPGTRTKRRIYPLAHRQPRSRRGPRPLHPVDHGLA
jgi:hypothetical protein